MSSEATESGKKKTVESKKNLSFFARIWLFIRQVVFELKKVHYPTRNEMGTYFMVVLVFVGIIMLYIFVIDLGFDNLIKLIYG